MKNMVNKLDELLKDEEKLPPKLKEALKKRKEILSNDKTVKK